MNGEHTKPVESRTEDGRVNSRVKLDFEQRARACKLEDSVGDDLYATAAEIIFLRDRNTKLERLLALSVELCDAIDLEAIDVGGTRPSLTILQDIGPLSRELERK